MRSFIIVLGLVFTASAQALNCVDTFGSHAYLTQAGPSKVLLTFESSHYPASGVMNYNGDRSVSYYFTGFSNMVEIEKSVFSSGVGAMYYHYLQVGGEHDRNFTAIFNCK